MGTDEQTDTAERQPTKRMTTSEMAAKLEEFGKQVAEALEKAQSADDMAAVLSVDVTDLKQRAVTEWGAEQDPVAATLAEDALADQIDAAIDRKNNSLLARFEDAERQVASAIGKLETATDRDGVDNLAGEMARINRQLFELSNKVEASDRTIDLPALISTVATQVRARLNPPRSTPGSAGDNGAQRKVLELMRLVTHIGKEKEANLGKGGRFLFRGVDDAMDAVGHALRQVGLIMSTDIVDREIVHTPVTQSGIDKGERWERTVVWSTTVLTVRYTFIDPDDGSTHSFTMAGEGRDSSDKSTSKAASMALKYGLFQGLMIPVSGLDDSDNESPHIAQSSRHLVDQPTEGPAEQPGAPASQSSSNTDQRADNASRHQRAQQALDALRKAAANTAETMEQRRARVNAIWEQVQREELASVELDGASLRGHVISINRTLGGGGDA